MSSGENTSPGDFTMGDVFSPEDMEYPGDALRGVPGRVPSRNFSMMSARNEVLANMGVELDPNFAAPPFGEMEPPRPIYFAKNVYLKSSFPEDPRRDRSDCMWEIQRGGGAFLYDSGSSGRRKAPNLNVQIQLRRGEMKDRLAKIFTSNARARSAPAGSAAAGKWKTGFNMIRAASTIWGRSLVGGKNQPARAVGGGDGLSGPGGKQGILGSGRGKRGGLGLEEDGTRLMLQRSFQRWSGGELLGGAKSERGGSAGRSREAGGKQQQQTGAAVPSTTPGSAAGKLKDFAPARAATHSLGLADRASIAERGSIAGSSEQKTAAGKSGATGGAAML